MADDGPEIPSLLRHVTGFFADVIDWLVATFEDPVISAAIRADLGLDPDDDTPPPVDDARLAGIRTFADSREPTAESFAQVVEDTVSVAEALGGWIDAIRTDDGQVDEVLYLLFAMGARERLRIRAPMLHTLAEGAVVVRDAFGAAPGVDEAGLGSLLEPVLDALRTVLAVPTPLDVPERTLDVAYAERVSNVAAVALALAAIKGWLPGDTQVFHGWDHPVPESGSPIADELSQRVLTLVIGDTEDGSGGAVSITLALVPIEHGGPGMVLSLGGELHHEHTVPRPLRAPLAPGDPRPALAYRLEVAAGGLGAFIDFRDITEAAGGADIASALSLGVRPVVIEAPGEGDDEPTIRDAPRGVPAFRIDLPGDQTFIEIGSFGGGVEFGPGRARVELVLRDIDLVVALGDADDFVRTQGDRDVLFGFDLAIIADTETGLSFGGGSGFHVAIPVSRSLPGPFVAHYLEVEVVPSEDRDLALLVRGSMGLKLGPVTAVVEGIGFLLDIAFEAGNVGLADVDMGFMAPRGVALALEVGDLAGGGFLFFDQPRGEYAGVLELKWASVTFKAIGILTTKLPDGSPGWSLLVMLFAEFDPIPIGFGFTLTGLGGMIGIQHGIRGEALRAGLRTGVLDDVLFPRDPVANAPRLLNQLRAVFPVTPRALTFGPFARIAYGDPAFLTIQLGVLFELDNVFRSPGRDVELTRLVVVGQLRIELPAPKGRPKAVKPVVKVIVDLVGEIDFQARALAIDARLRDSKLSGMTLTGSLVVRGRWGTDRRWIVAVGGFHPEFDDLPPGLPKQDRVGLSLKKGIATVKFEAYLAITSNSFQFGARVFAQAKKWGFTVEGWLGFDTLVEFDPARFVASIEAGVALKKGSRTLMGIDLSLTVRGPGRWHLVGRAKFKVLFLSKTIKFDESWGEDPQELVSSIDTEAELARILSSPGSWSAALPAGGEMLVSLRSPDGAAGAGEVVRAHPLGALTGMQRLVPLDLQVDRVNGAVPTGARRFAVTHVEVGGVDVPASAPGRPGHEPVPDHFATGQFLDLSDDQRLSLPSFERHPAGVAVASEAIDVPASHVSATLDFETIRLPRRDAPAPRPRRTLPMAVLVAQARSGAAARSPLRVNRFLAGAAVVDVRLADPRHVAVDAVTHGDVRARATSATALRDVATVGAMAAARRGTRAGTVDAGSAGVERRGLGPARDPSGGVLVLEEWEVGAGADHLGLVGVAR